MPENKTPKSQPPAAIKIVGGKNNTFHRVETNGAGPAFDIENTENLTVHSLKHATGANQTVFNVSSTNSSGITAGQIGQVIVNPPAAPRAMTDDFRASLLNGIRRDVAVLVLARQGDREAQEFADQIHTFLSTSGQKMAAQTVSWHMFGTQRADVTVTPFRGLSGPEVHVIVESKK